MTTSYDGLADRFAATFGRAPTGVWAAPGRVNLIGEHVDYNDGLVLPFALTQRTYAAVAPREDGLVAARMLRADGSLSEPVAELEPGRLTDWPAYVAGVLWALREDGHDVRGMDVLLDGHVPVGAGLSSSAALECAVAVAAAELSGLALDGAALAKVAQRAENDFVGVPCGLMDQMASITCQEGHALLYDVRSEQAEQVPFAPRASALALLVIDTRLKHSVGDGAYADRRSTCEEAAKALGVPSLRDVSAAELDDVMSRLPAHTVPRVRHVVTEIVRVSAAADALRAGEWPRLGALMTASHVSLRDDYEVSSAELDVAVDTALGAGALGARMTGAGFGGSAIALVPAESADDLAAAVTDVFASRGFGPPGMFAADPGPGATRLT
jgi:galactokinase